MRTSNVELVTAVKEISQGEASVNTLQFLESCRKPLTVDDRSKLVLFGLRINAQMHNLDCVMKHPGNFQTYRAVDDGSQKRLSQLIAPKVIIQI